MNNAKSAKTFDAAASARRVLQAARTGALSTLEPNGHPYVSLAGVAALPDGTPILLLSTLARHTANIQHDPRVSLLLGPEQRSGDPMASARVTIIGRIVNDDRPVARETYLARLPEAAQYADFKDFSFWRIEPESAHLVAGFGRIVTLMPKDLGE